MKCLLILLVVVHLGNADEVINDYGDYNYDVEVPNKRYKKVDTFSLYNVWFMSFGQSIEWQI